jgi:hypothetical protein
MVLACVACFACLALLPLARAQSPLLLSMTNLWAYEASGTDLDATWPDPLVEDSVFWPSGRGLFGVENDPQIQPLILTPLPLTTSGTNIRTYYFRTTFAFTNNLTNVTLVTSNLIDDGAVFYLNGVEVYRQNMPTGVVQHSTFAATNRSVNEAVYTTNAIASGPLVKGQNVLAVEVHQSTATSADIVFGTALFAFANSPSNPPPSTNPPAVTVTRGPYLQNAVSNAVSIRWRTSAPAESHVRFGTDENQLTEVVSNVQLKTEHEIRLTNLLGNTRYYYALWTAASNIASGPTFYFNTPPVTSKPTRIWALGDFGTASANARAVVNAFTNFNRGEPADVMLLLGDNAYGSGTQTEYQRAFFGFIPDVLRKTLLWSTMGNHETYSTGNPGLFPYVDIFSPPIAGEAGGVPSGTEFYYSFDYGNIHFVCMDSEVSGRATNGAMVQWLEQDLAANTKDWLIAFWHSPPYTKGSHDSDNINDSAGRMAQMRENILPILEAHGVDLVLSGHSHCYERSFLLDGHYGYSTSLQPHMFKDKGDGRETGTGAYRKAGTGPAGRQGALYIVAGSSGFATFGSMNHPVMAVSYLRMGSLILDVDGHRLDGTFLRETGAIDDRFTILKGAGPESLRIAQFRLNNGQVFAAWKSVAGRRYRVESSTAVTGASWTPVSEIVEATGATSFWNGTMPENAEVYLRVREMPPE